MLRKIGFVKRFLLNRYDRRRCNKIRKAFVGRKTEAYNVGNEQYENLTIDDVYLLYYNRNLNQYSFVFTFSNGHSTTVFLDGTLYDNLKHVDSKQLGTVVVLLHSDRFEQYIVLNDVGNTCLKEI